MLVGAGSAWFGGKAFGGGDKAKAIYKYHRYAPVVVHILKTLNHVVTYLTKIIYSVSGYLLLVFLLYTAHLGGAWSTWVVMSASYPVRVLAYTVAPIIVLVAVYSRARYVSSILALSLLVPESNSHTVL